MLMHHDTNGIDVNYNESRLGNYMVDVRVLVTSTSGKGNVSRTLMVAGLVV